MILLNCLMVCLWLTPACLRIGVTNVAGLGAGNRFLRTSSPTSPSVNEENWNASSESGHLMSMKNRKRLMSARGFWSSSCTSNLRQLPLEVNAKEGLRRARCAFHRMYWMAMLQRGLDTQHKVPRSYSFLYPNIKCDSNCGWSMKGSCMLKCLGECNRTQMDSSCPVFWVGSLEPKD